jgi:hypothetical protein
MWEPWLARKVATTHGAEKESTMPSIFEKNLSLNAKATSVVGAAQSYRLSGVHICAPGARCELCHQPIKKGADVRSDRTDRKITIGLDCLQRLEFIQRAGRQPEKGELADCLKQRKRWKGEARRRPLVASAVAYFQRRRAGLPSDVRKAFDFLEVAGHPRTIQEGELLLAYYRQADPLWLLRLVRSRLAAQSYHWQTKLGTVITFTVMGAESFNQVRRSDSNSTTLLHLSRVGGYVHEWTYNPTKGSITLKRFTRSWYAWYGAHRAYACAPSRTQTVRVTTRNPEAAPSLDRQFMAAQFEAAGYRVTLC